MRGLRPSLFLVLLVALSACNQAARNFVNGALPGSRQPDSVAPNLDSPSTLKITPGQVSATATNGRMEATITPTQRSFTGGDIHAELSLSRIHVKAE